MPVAATKEYVGVSRDAVANFNGKQLVYASWDQHLLFAAPFLMCVPIETTFRELVNGPLTALIQPDPDAAQVDWAQVKWQFRSKPPIPSNTN